MILKYEEIQGSSLDYNGWTVFCEKYLGKDPIYDIPRHLFSLKKEILEWLKVLRIEYKISTLVRFENIAGSQLMPIFSGFILDFERTEDEILFKLTWM